MAKFQYNSSSSAPLTNINSQVDRNEMQEMTIQSTAIAKAFIGTLGNEPIKSEEAHQKALVGHLDHLDLLVGHLDLLVGRQTMVDSNSPVGSSSRGHKHCISNSKNYR